MFFIDDYNGETVVIPDLYKEWKTGVKSEPENYDQSFLVYVFNVILAAINERNDLSVHGITKKELKNIIKRIEKAL